MTTQVTVRLPSELYQHAKQWATFTRRDLSETLADALALVLDPVYTNPRPEKNVVALSDTKVLALSRARLKLAQGRRLHALLQKQREGDLSDPDRRELAKLMQIYHQLWLRQSEALAEAVRRGLRAPLKA